MYYRGRLIYDAPTVVAPQAVTIAENTTLVAADLAGVDAEDGFAALSLGNDGDSALFALAAGTLSFRDAPDFEMPDDADGDNVYQVEVKATDQFGAIGSTIIAVTVEDVVEQTVEFRINEFHYDNASIDTGEFVEVRVTAGALIDGLVLELYNGSNQMIYDTYSVDEGTKTSDGTFDYYVIDTPGIQNGPPDALALSIDGALIEFLSYEGTLTGVGGAADGVTSIDIGVEEVGSTPVGFSLQRGEGDVWDEPRTETRGIDNSLIPLFLNEIAVNTTGTPDFEFFELFGVVGTSLDGYSLIQVEAATDFNPGNILTVISLDGQVIGEDGFFLAASPEAEADFGVAGDLLLADDSFENFDSTFLLVQNFDASEGDDIDVDDDGEIDDALVIIDGVGLADSGPSLFYGDVAVVGPDGAFLAPGARRTDDGGGIFTLTPFSDTNGYTPGASNAVAGALTLISAIQGTGEASTLVGAGVEVEAIVTAIVSNGFFIQEEDSDADGNDATSEGIFVFTGAAPSVSLGDKVSVLGTVVEFDCETQLSYALVTVLESVQTLPTAAALLVGPTTTPADYEAVEGMRVSATTATEDALTITANFNFDRFGELQISAGTKRQATQQFEPGSPEALALIEANGNNTLILADADLGFTNQNPDAYPIIPVAPEFDNGNGFLDAGDDFGGDDGLGFTLRLGTAITDPVVGVMKQEAIFDDSEYKLVVTDALTLDPGTAARPALEDVGGTLQIASVNVLNYFATLDIGDAGVGPDDLNPRGADSQSELDRQTDKLVLQLQALEAEVLGLQELGNDGLGPEGSIAVLTAALNAQLEEDGDTAVYDYVDPTTGDEVFIGTDAITTGIVYDTTALTLLYADFLVFDEASAAATFALADVLNPFADAGDQVGDFQRNRPAVAATFEDQDSGEIFTVVSVHFKSKGPSDLDTVVEAAIAGGADQADIDALLADPNYDQEDGQGFWNQARADAAGEVVAWMNGQYLLDLQAAAGVSTEKHVILGDYNAYAEEDPTTTVRDAEEGYVDLIDTFAEGGQDAAYSFVFDGQQGTLDQAIATTALAGDVADVFEWHVNADEPDLLNYDESFANPDFYDENLFGASDHDPLLLGLDFGADSLV